MSRSKAAHPVDCGWAWMVMLACFLNVAICISFNRATALFVTEFLDHFQESTTATTVALGAAPISFSVCNILLPSVLMPRFSNRVLVLVGGTLAAVSVTCMSLARSMSAMTVCFGIMGFGHGLILVPQTSLLGLYFERRLAFANAFAFMGMAVATIFSPIIAQRLLEIYGLQGTLLIFGAFSFNIIPSSLLFRPVSAYKEVETVVMECNESSRELCSRQSNYSISSLPKVESDEMTPERSSDQANTSGEPENTCDLSCIQDDKNKSILNQTGLKSSGILPDFGHTRSSHENNQPRPGSSYRKHSELLSTEAGELRVGLTPDSQESSDRGIYLYSHCNDNHPEVTAAAVKMTDISGDFSQEHSSVCGGKYEAAIQRSTDPTGQSLKSDVNILPIGLCWLRLTTCLRGSVYIRPVTLMLLLASGLAVHTQPSVTYLPALGEENGLSSEQVPYLLTVSGVSMLVGKLSIGFLADLRFCNRLYIVAAVNLVLGGAFQFTRACRSLASMLALSVAIGALSGVVDFLLPVLVSDLLGKQFIGHVMSGFLLLNGVFMSTDHVMVGAIKDATGHFYISYHYMGGLTLLGVLVYMLMPLVVRRKKSQHTIDKDP